MKLSNPLKSAIIIGLTGIIILCLVIYVELKTSSINTENQPLIALVEHLKNNSSKAHLWFEEAMAGDTTIVLDRDVYGYLDSSARVLKVVLAGGQTGLGVFHKTTDSETVCIINRSLFSSDVFKSLAKQRMGFKIRSLSLENKSGSKAETIINYGEEIGGVLDQAFDAAYEKLEDDYSLLAEHIKLKIAQDNSVLYRLFWTSIFLIVIVFVVFSFLLYRILKNENTAKEALKLSENELRNIFACMDDAVFELSSDGVYLKIPPTNPSLLYKPADNLLGKQLNEVLPEKEARWFVDQIQKTLKENKIIHTEYPLLIDTKTHIFEATVSPLTHHSVLWIARDITARKSAEEQIIKSQKKLEEAQRLSNIGSWEFNLITSELTWSKELYRIFELENLPSPILREAYRRKFHPEDIVKLDNALNRIIETGEGYSFEHRMICNDGTIKDLLCIGETIKNAEGKVIGIKGTEQDITERKKIETLLKEKEQNALLVRHAEQVPGVIYQIQVFPDGKKYSFPFISEGVQDLCEVSVEEVMRDGFQIFRYVDKEDWERLKLSFETSLKTMENWTCDYKVNLPKKGIRWLRGNSKPEKLADGSIIWHGYLMDITERKMTTNQLDKQKEFYEKILNNLPIEIAVFDTEHKYLFVNPASIKNDDLRKYIIGKDDFEYCEYRKRDISVAQNRRDQFLKVKQYGKSIEWEDSIIGSDGRAFSNLRGMLPIYDDNGKLAQVIGFGMDITARKEIEQRLMESEKLLSGILQTLPVAVFCKDIQNEFRFSLWNKKAEEIFGLTAEQCIGKDDYYFFPKEDADGYRKNDIEASKMLGVLDIPEEVVETEDRKAIVHTQKIIVRDTKGVPHFLIGVSEDITLRKEAEEKIKKSEEKYRSVVENAVDTIITFDKNGTIQFINHTRSNTTVEKVIGTSIYNFIPIESIDEVKQKIEKAFKNKISNTYELPIKHSDGTIVWYSTNFGPVFSGNEVSALTIIIRDITERKQDEEKIKQSLKEKEVLLKEVHHRVKNNLQIIISILNLQYANIKDKKTLELLRDVRSRIKAMSFIHELLYQASDFSNINFSEYLTSITTNLVYSYSPNKTVDLKLDIDNVSLDLDRAIPCGLIVNELLTNALKYAFYEGKNDELSISLKESDGLITLIISDNGKGFPATIDYKKTESLGMQLVITLVEQLSGTISLDNSNGVKYTIKFQNK